MMASLVEDTAVAISESALGSQRERGGAPWRQEAARDRGAWLPGLSQAAVYEPERGLGFQGHEIGRVSLHALLTGRFNYM